jgi:type I restriction enzyme S subunit
MFNGDIVINSTGTGTIGRVGIYHDSDNPAAIPIVPDSHVTVVRVCEHIDSSYVFLFLKAMQANLEKLGEGSTNQKELKPLTVQSIRFPMPPLAEQRIISKRVSEMFSLLDQVEEKLL